MQNDPAPSPDSQSDSRKVPGTAAFSRFMTVLQAIADAPGELGIADICERSGLPRATVYRITAALRAEGMIAGQQAFTLGPRLIDLASRSWENFDLRHLAHDTLRQLRDQTGETVHLAVPSGLEMVYIDKLESLQKVRMTSRIGTRVLLYASSVGKAYLALLAEDERHGMLDRIVYRRMTAHTISGRSELERELAQVAERGYALDREETELEILCIGAAIRNHAGEPVGGISISVPKYRFRPETRRKHAKLVVEAARQISARIAHAGSPNVD